MQGRMFRRAMMLQIITLALLCTITVSRKNRMEKKRVPSIPPYSPQLHIVTYASRITEAACASLRSADINGLGVRVLTFSSEVRASLKEIPLDPKLLKIYALHNFLNQKWPDEQSRKLHGYPHPDDIILFYDGYDVLFQANATDIINRYQNLARQQKGDVVIFGGERSCFPIYDFVKKEDLVPGGRPLYENYPVEAIPAPAAAITTTTAAIDTTNSRTLPSAAKKTVKTTVTVSGRNGARSLRANATTSTQSKVSTAAGATAASELPLSTFRFLNAGILIGTASGVRKLVAKAVQCRAQSGLARGDDQYMYQIIYLMHKNATSFPKHFPEACRFAHNERIHIMVDAGGLLFLNAWGTHSMDKKLINVPETSGAYFDTTKWAIVSTEKNSHNGGNPSIPAVIHFNGGKGVFPYLSQHVYQQTVAGPAGAAFRNRTAATTSTGTGAPSSSYARFTFGVNNTEFRLKDQCPRYPDLGSYGDDDHKFRVPLPSFVISFYDRLKNFVNGFFEL